MRVAEAGCTSQGPRKSLRRYHRRPSCRCHASPAASRPLCSASRLLALDRDSGEAVAEYVYVSDAVSAAPQPGSGFATNGLVELLHVPGSDDLLLAVERSFSEGVGNSIKLYLAHLDGATDVLGIDSLQGRSYASVQKELLLDLGSLGVALDNIEGLTWGPSINGRQTLVLVADNNFASTQVTQFLAFEVTPVPEPETYALTLAGLAAVALATRRRRG
ncbi:esterase-like activity of phytase family protein [Aquabacterium sp. A7-Y]|uniref:esterase-like activity of phytase family protein n=1 Tax=Aquabacterium sp. A7-Y TaxID=1349605 RepID=UPI00223D7612|nr:esterase-like activity of phytase family protein [Aquabacterium sp. A7-Y]MCW7536582.1 esterase-like activity of phytase family protein [Aquabacterium sp. A7-Y]